MPHRSRAGHEIGGDVLRGELVEVAAGVQDDRRETTKRTLAEAWQRAAAGHTLLDGVGLPPVALSDDDLEEWSERQKVPQRRRGRHGDDRGVRRDRSTGSLDAAIVARRAILADTAS
ncbi:hypothetical protein [Streptomyces sp. NPDC012746]|uniref:hypothetical protein n=1 Tax=Streptomyces sp. NPDC012746 TaxID=3364845 RepID=UPI00368758D3